MYPVKFTVRMSGGRSDELCMAMGNLSISPTCIGENNGYPYKSSQIFIRHALYREEKVVAFSL